MFTGIVTDIGHVRALRPGKDTRMEIATAYDSSGIDIGASIACSGPCLTVIARGRDEGGDWFAVEVSPETMSRTTVGTWTVGRRINLERALRLGDELGGHMVSGHIDGIATVAERTRVGDEAGSERFTIRAPGGYERLVAAKGSVALDGVSLTVNDIAGPDFTVNVIPHTLAHTTLGEAGPGTALNFEADVIARYVARLSGG